MNRATDEEIGRAITPAFRSELGAALDAVRALAAPASDDELLASITMIVGLIGQDWVPDKREEFITLVTLELSTLPGSLVLDSLARARRRVTAGRMLVSWVCSDVEPRAAKLADELKALDHLARIAGIA